MQKDHKQNKTSGYKRTLVEWGGIVAVVALLYITGLHTQVLGTMQQALLWTGLYNAEAKEMKAADGPTLSENAYQLRLKSPDGEQMRLQQFKGKVLFVNIWASWCPPCVAEMPTIETLYNNVSGNEDIKFLLISMDENPQKAVDFMKGENFSMPGC